MKRFCLKSGFVLFWSIWAFSPVLLSQNKNENKIDTEVLRKRYAITKSETDWVKLKYWVGKSESIMRLTYWDSVLAIANKKQQHLYTCRALWQKSIVYTASGDIPTALDFANRALAIAEQQQYQQETIELIKSLEHIYARQLNRAKSLEMSYRGLRVAEKIDDKRAVIDFNSSIARYYWSTGDLDKALEVQLNCLKLAKEIVYEFGISSALVDIGSIYVAKNEGEKSVPYYLECKNYAHVVAGTIYEADIYNSVGAAFQFLKQYDSAYYYTLKGYEIAVALQNKQGMCSLQSSLAGICLLKGNYTEAEHLAKEALDLANKSAFTAQGIELLMSLKQIYVKQGKYLAALEVYEEYITLRDRVSNEKVRKEALEKAYTYDLEKKQNENLVLSQRNAIQKLQLNQSNVLLLGAAGVFLVLLVILFLYKRQIRYRADFLQLQSEQRLLRSQMNPHFIFNSLNAIKQFVMTERNRDAELYLSKFAKLIRNLLERSMEENIRVSEEVEILKGYLEMESLRFEDSFQYTLSCDESTEFKNFRIPQSMLQPLVENAIWHGLLPKESNRKVTITLVRNSEKTIQCTIDDNGVGRKGSVNAVNNDKSKSLAIHFIQQRLSRMRPSDNVICTMQIIDKHDSKGNSLGTKVVIVLPILN